KLSRSAIWRVVAQAGERGIAGEDLCAPVATRVRLLSGEQGLRFAADSGLFRAQADPEHPAIYGAQCRPVCGTVVGLLRVLTASRISRRLWRCSLFHGGNAGSNPAGDAIAIM